MAPHGNPSVQKLISERQLPSHLHRRTSVRFPSPISFISGNWNVRHTCWSIMTEGTNKQHAVFIVLITYDDLWYSSRFLFFWLLLFFCFFLQELNNFKLSPPACEVLNSNAETERKLDRWRRAGWGLTGNLFLVGPSTVWRDDEDEKNTANRWWRCRRGRGWTRQRNIGGVGGVEEEAVKEKNNTVLRESQNMTWQS